MATADADAAADVLHVNRIPKRRSKGFTLCFICFSELLSVLSCLLQDLLLSAQQQMVRV